MFEPNDKVKQLLGRHYSPLTGKKEPCSRPCTIVEVASNGCSWLKKLTIPRALVEYSNGTRRWVPLRELRSL